MFYPLTISIDFISFSLIVVFIFSCFNHSIGDAISNFIEFNSILRKMIAYLNEYNLELQLVWSEKVDGAAIVAARCLIKRIAILLAEMLSDAEKLIQHFAGWLLFKLFSSLLAFQLILYDYLLRLLAFVLLLNFEYFLSSGSISSNCWISHDFIYFFCIEYHLTCIEWVFDTANAQ